MSTSLNAPAAVSGLDQALLGLRDVRLPEPVSWWPLAPVWWWIAGCALVSIGVALVVMHRRRRTLRHAALRELRALRRRADPARSSLELATTLGALMRRTALAGDAGSAFASAHDEAWIAHLHGGTDGMPTALAAFIADAPYARRGSPSGEPDRDARAPGGRSSTVERATAAVSPGASRRAAPNADELFDVTERWLRRHA